MAGPLSSALAAAIDGPALPPAAKTAWQDTSALAMVEADEDVAPPPLPAVETREDDLLPPPAPEEPAADDLYAEPPVGDAIVPPPADDFSEVVNALREGAQGSGNEGPSSDNAGAAATDDETSDIGVARF
jgi:hypothetical protein